MISCLIYLAIGLSISILTNIISYNHGKRWLLIFPIIIYTVAVGCRSETGTDWPVYKEIYEGILSNNIFSTEYLYQGINYSFAYLGFNYIWLFLIFAFLQILLIYTGIFHNKIQSSITLIILLYFLCGPFFSSMNIMRQSLAFCIFFNSIPLITKKRFKSYLAVIILMTGIHTSSIILLPFYILGKSSVKINYQVQIIILFFISLFVGTYIFESLGEYFFSIIKLEQFARYAINFEDNNFEYGIGVWVFKFIDLGIIWYSYKLKSVHNSNVNVIYWIFVVGVIISNIAISNQLIIRLSYCLISFRFVLLAIITKILLQESRKGLTIFRAYLFSSWSLIFLAFFSSILKNNNGIYPYKSLFESWL